MNHCEHYEKSSLNDDLDDAWGRISAPSYGEAEDQERTSRTNEPCVFDYDILTLVAEKNPVRAIIALTYNTNLLFSNERIHAAVEELLEAKEEDMGAGGPPVNYGRVLHRHRELIQSAMRCLEEFPKSPCTQALALWAATQLQKEAPWETLEIVYVNAIRLDRLAREFCDDPLDLPDCPNEVIRRLLNEE